MSILGFLTLVLGIVVGALLSRWINTRKGAPRAAMIIFVTLVWLVAMWLTCLAVLGVI